MSELPWWIVPLALAFDGWLGEPAWLYARIAHPVVWLGRLVAALDCHLNRDDETPRRRRWAGVAAVLGLVAIAVAVGWAFDRALAAVPGGSLAAGLIGALLASTLIAQRSLYQHVAAVATALESGGLAQGRRAVSMIVGRDPDSLDRAGVARAAIESCAENFSDGVVAPVFWLALGGLPGLIAYKAINTADSMIGHRTPRHRDFGWAAARLDDLVNLVPARLSGLLLALASGRRCGAAIKIMLRDAGHHRSPNAGWPEAAIAGALDLALAGPRRYHGQTVDDAWIGGGGRTEAGPAEIRGALNLLVHACGLLWLVSCLVLIGFETL